MSKYHTKILWEDLIAIGRSSGLSDEEIVNRLCDLESVARKADESLFDGCSNSHNAKRGTNERKG